jgi:nitric oxide reductase NorE protein
VPLIRDERDHAPAGMPDDTGEADWGPLSGLPGNPMMWILILGELAVFGAFFVGLTVARTLDPVAFDRILGGINTLVLITSGWLAALAISAKTAGGNPRPLLGGAIALGVAFLVVKGIEYRAKLAAGFGIETDTFFTLYYLLTGFHALHVIMGVIVLVIVAWRDSIANLETGCAFWHMVDLIWVILYPLLYLIR